MRLAWLPWTLPDLIGVTSQAPRATKSDFAALPLLVRTMSALRSLHRSLHLWPADIDHFCPKAPTSRQCGFHFPSLVVWRSWIESQNPQSAPRRMGAPVWEHHHHAFCRDELPPPSVRR